jgi:hypothetical protein
MHNGLALHLLYLDAELILGRGLRRRESRTKLYALEARQDAAFSDGSALSQ